MKIPDFELEHFFARWEFVAPLMLGSSDAETLGVQEVLALADEECRRWWNGLTLGYTEVPGHPLLRQAIASLYQGLEAGEVAVFAGAQEAVFAFMNVALAPGDHAVVTWPGYQSLYEVARTIGAEVTLLPLRPESGWRLDLEALEQALRPNTRVIVVNFPHNPTGAHLDKASFERVLALGRERGAAVFSDEVYRYAEHRDEDRLPAAAERGAVSLGVMSKAFGLAGLRIGWIASRDRELLQRLLAFKHYLTICNSAPAEVLATIALRARQTVLERNRHIVLDNLAHLDRFFQEWAGVFEWVRPRAGNVAFPRLNADVSIEQFAAELVEAEGVLIVPGTVFDHPGNHFRLGLARRNLPVAVAGLERFARNRLAIR
jgi:aspartate/methionine/tyrosine aminotransferase